MVFYTRQKHRCYNLLVRHEYDEANVVWVLVNKHGATHMGRSSMTFRGWIGETALNWGKWAESSTWLKINGKKKQDNRC